ncbi:MAG: hypothetical protein ABWY27_08745 [Telluria sp.]
MKRLLLVAALCWSSSAWSARTPFQARCEDTIGATVVTLTSSENGHSIDNTVPFRALTRMKQQGGGASFVLGLTRTESRISFALDGAILTDPKTRYECVAPRIDVTLAYQPIVIYVGREFLPGTCAYQQILAHEMRHLKAYLEHLPKVDRLVRAALKSRFAGQPIYAPAGQAKRLLEQEMDGGWMPYIKNEMAKVERLQAAIDSPQEYARLSKVCAGEVQLLVGPPKRNRR